MNQQLGTKQVQVSENAMLFSASQRISFLVESTKVLYQKNKIDLGRLVYFSRPASSLFPVNRMSTKQKYCV